MTTYSRSHSLVKIAAPMVCAMALLVGCEKSNEQATNADTGYFSMDLPDSMTGGKSVLATNGVATKASVVLSAASSSDVPCVYLGVEDDKDPFRNGYEMSKFLVSVVAVWTCVADNVIHLADTVAHDGAFVATDNDKSSENYDVEEPTHYSVNDDSDTQSSLRMYYGFTTDTPPTSSDLAGVYLSWNENTAGDVQGKLIIDLEGLAKEITDPEDPVAMRLDFDNNSAQKLATMYLQFPGSNQWADGFRIEVTKDLTIGSDQRVFTARGLLSMKGQFTPTNGVSEFPAMKMYTVSDAFGEGAAIAEFNNVALPLVLNEGNNLGNYIFSKEDKYFFDANQKSAQAWDWISKSITSSEYRGGRTTPATDESVEAPSLEFIITALNLDANYFTGAQCGDLNSDCTELMNAIFQDGFAGQEQNQGSEPADWRSTAIQAATYLDSVLPIGEAWETMFDQSFTPAS